MPTYTATFYTDANYAEHEFKAKTPKQALAAAREVEGGDDSSLYYESYDQGHPVNAITIREGRQCCGMAERRIPLEPRRERFARSSGGADRRCASRCRQLDRGRSCGSGTRARCVDHRRAGSNRQGKTR
jgi:hypothetical protein